MFSLRVFLEDQNSIAIGWHQEWLLCPAIDLFLGIWFVDVQPLHIPKSVIYTVRCIFFMQMFRVCDT